jgi:hypothetical protein
MKPRRTKRYPKDIGKRWCKKCIRETYFRWSDSRNTFVCELCDYEEALTGIGVIASEIDFIQRLNNGEIP